ncbi:hypothetical protein Pmani_036911, partial [Petrolisthes manimaculis]
ELLVRPVMNLEEVTETDMDDEFFNEDADMGAGGYSMEGKGGSRTKRGRERGLGRQEATSSALQGLESYGTTSYDFPPKPPQDLPPPSKRKRNPSLKEVTSMGGSLAITVSTGSQESSAPPLPSPNPQRSPGIILGVEEAKPSSPGVTFSDTPSILPESSRNGRAGELNRDRVR